MSTQTSIYYKALTTDTCSMDAVSDSSTKKVDSPDRMWSRAPYSLKPKTSASCGGAATSGNCRC
jgi:hypothetical protein